MHRGWLGLGVAVLTAHLGGLDGMGGQAPAPGADPLEFLAPWATLSPGERRRLDDGEVVARTLPGVDRQAAILVVARVQATPDHLVAWSGAIERFKRSRFVLAIGRFSEPPRLSDLDGLTIDDDDVNALTRCRVGDCALKLTAAEMEAFAVLRTTPPPARAEAAQAAFRRAVFDRLQAYRSGGLAGLSPLADRDRRRIADGFDALVERSPYLARVPALADWLRRYPDGPAPSETFFYWSKESYGSGKPVVSVTHVGIHRTSTEAGLPAVIVAGKQLLATHYTVASLGLTMLVGGRDGGPRYLVYLNRTEVDLLGGLFGGIARIAMDRRLGRQAPLVVEGLRRRLESGFPDASPP